MPFFSDHPETAVSICLPALFPFFTPNPDSNYLLGHVLCCVRATTTICSSLYCNVCHHYTCLLLKQRVFVLSWVSLTAFVTSHYLLWPFFHDETRTMLHEMFRLQNTARNSSSSTYMYVCARKDDFC